MKKILIVNQSANYLMVDIARSFIRSGKYEKVCLLVGNPKGVTDAEEKGFEVKSMYPYNKKSILTRFHSWVLGTIQIIWKVKRQYNDFDLFLVSNPPTIHFLPYLCKNKFASLVYDVYPDGIVSGGFVTRKNWIFKIWSKAARNFFSKAESIYAISEGIANTVSLYCERNKISVVPLWANNDILKVEKTENPFITEHKLYDKFVILYSGNIGKGSNIGVLIRLAEKMQRYKDIKFVIIGEGMEKVLVEKAIVEQRLDNILLLPYQPLNTLSNSLSSADLAYVSVERKAANVCIPSKTFNLLNVEVPLICIANPEAEIWKMVERNSIGEVFQPDKIEDIETFILEMKNNKIQYDLYRKNVGNLKQKYTSTNADKFLSYDKGC
ncbi:MAG: glycosyltransferase family 4 protein [Lachnospiraceae bacterium]|nr:glycosyltransferase family 4 protein [Lachnospiraceae bacterium]